MNRPWIALLLMCIGAASGGELTKPPHRFGVVVRSGIVFSRLEGEGTAGYVVDPLEKAVESRAAIGGAELDWRIFRFAAVSTGFHITRIGQPTPKSHVEFQSSPFMHDFETSLSLRYLRVPLRIKVGYIGDRHTALISWGPEGSLLLQDEFVWKIDGVENRTPRYSPDYAVDTKNVALNVGCEYGLQIGRSTLMIAAEYSHGIRNLLLSPSGEVVSRALGLSLGYRLAVF